MSMKQPDRLCTWLLALAVVGSACVPEQDPPPADPASRSTDGPANGIANGIANGVALNIPDPIADAFMVQLARFEDGDVEASPSIKERGAPTTAEWTTANDNVSPWLVTNKGQSGALRVAIERCSTSLRTAYPARTEIALRRECEELVNRYVQYTWECMANKDQYLAWTFKGVGGETSRRRHPGLVGIADEGWARGFRPTRANVHHVSVCLVARMTDESRIAVANHVGVVRYHDTSRAGSYADLCSATDDQPNAVIEQHILDADLFTYARWAASDASLFPGVANLTAVGGVPRAWALVVPPNDWSCPSWQASGLSRLLDPRRVLPGWIKCLRMSAVPEGTGSVAPYSESAADTDDCLVNSDTPRRTIRGGGFRAADAGYESGTHYNQFTATTFDGGYNAIGR